MIGDIIKVKGHELLVLDEINGNPFVIALNTGIDTKFNNDSNNYRNSIIKKKTEEWLRASGLKALHRTINLTTMDGYKEYGQLSVQVAPLTFDEYRKYADIIIPHVKHSFWLSTGWGRPTSDDSDWAANCACIVYGDGLPTHSGSCGLAPAFILNNSCTEKDLSDFTNEELMAEISRRMKTNDKKCIF